MITNHLKMYILTLTAVLLPAFAHAQRGLYIGEDVPIVLYGKVIDQYANPVVGAKISVLVVITHYAINSGEQKELTTQTDENGNFSLTGVTAHGIHISSIGKDGYELSPKSERDFVYGLPHRPPETSPEKPLIFKMWKQQGKEPLAHSVWNGKVVCDGTTNRFDLNSGRISPDGNLEIVCERMPLKSPPQGNGRFDYKFEIAVIGGGVQPAQEEFTYLAPEEGYSKSLTFSQKANDSKWDAKIPIPKEYYFKTADGRYGTLFIDWYAAQNSPTHLEWNCSINPSGSRNLER
jgi:hypothetical protein